MKVNKILASYSFHLTMIALRTNIDGPNAISYTPNSKVWLPLLPWICTKVMVLILYDLSLQVLQRSILGAAIERNNLKPLHSENTYPLRSLYFRCKNYLRWLLDQDLTCLIFLLRWACFPIEISRNAQWEHLFSMYFDNF